MNKKIVFFIPSIEGGGVEKNLFLVANYVSKTYTVEIITINNEFKKKFRNSINVVSPKFNFWKNYSRFIKYIICSVILVKKIIQNKKILIFCFQASFICILIAKIFSIKIILRGNSAPSGWIKNNLKKKIFSFIYSFADKIIVNSKEFKKEFYNFFKLKSICIYNPLDKKRIIPLSKNKIANKFYKKNTLNLINIGRLTDQKDHVTLLKAVKILPKNILYKLIIIGRGQNLKFLKNFINNNRLNKNVKIINFTENPYPFLKKSDIFILSSKYEGLPNILLEAIELNNYIISTNCKTGPKEILDNGKGGSLVKVGNFKAIKNAICFYQKNKKKCLKKKHYAKYRLKRFDENENLKKYLDVIENILNKI